MSGKISLCRLQLRSTAVPDIYDLAATTLKQSLQVTSHFFLSIWCNACNLRSQKKRSATWSFGMISHSLSAENARFCRKINQEKMGVATAQSGLFPTSMSTCLIFQPWRLIIWTAAFAWLIAVHVLKNGRNVQYVWTSSWNWPTQLSRNVLMAALKRNLYGLFIYDDRWNLGNFLQYTNTPRVFALKSTVRQRFFACTCSK